MTTLAEFEDFTTPDIRKRIVESVFESWNRLSKDAHKSLRMAVGTPNGFRRGKDLPIAMLKSESHSLAKQFPDFFSEVIMPAWVEASPELLKLTADHMKDRPPPADDAKTLDEYCNGQAEALSVKNGKYERDDFLVMVRYCAADADPSLYAEGDEADGGASYAGVTGIGILQFLMWLESLPADSSEWDDLVPRFAQDITSLILRKEDERSNLAAMTSMLTDIKAAHAEALEFFQADTSDWSDSKAAWVESRETLWQQAKSLKQAFEEYAEATRSGGNLAEERRLREQREQLEKAIESRVKRINELLQEAESPAESVRSMSLQDFIAGLEEIANEVIRGESATDGEDNPEEGSGADYSQERDTLKERLARLEEKNREMEGEVHRLQRQVTLWRSSYETERQSRDDSEPDPIPAEFTSVAHVLQVAEKRFADRLLFKFNSASDSSHPYDYPADVWNALEWLATTYYDSRTGANSVPNLDDSLREVSRFHYTPFQSNNTIGMYPESYFARVDGHKIPLKEHIGAGVDRKPTNTIRIAFNWDKQSDKVIVGYIGLHQHNRKT